MLLIKNGNLITMAGMYEQTGDILIDDGKIVKVEVNAAKEVKKESGTKKEQSKETKKEQSKEIQKDREGEEE